MFVLILLSALSCKDEPVGPCGVADPANDLPWLKAWIESKKGDGSDEFQRMAYIMRAEFEGNTVFYDGLCCLTCLYAPTFYDCAGNELEIEFSKPNSQLENPTLVWKHEASLCLF